MSMSSYGYPKSVSKPKGKKSKKRRASKKKKGKKKQVIMQTGDFLRKSQQGFLEEAEKLALELAEGHCSTLEAYKFVCGEVSGLRKASDILTEQVKQLHEEDDDD